MSRYTVFTGVGTALVTPFDDSGHVDLDALGTLIDRQIDGGADALVMTGTTGEAPVLSADEKRRYGALRAQGSTAASERSRSSLAAAAITPKLLRRWRTMRSLREPTRCLS